MNSLDHPSHGEEENRREALAWSDAVCSMQLGEGTSIHPSFFLHSIHPYAQCPQMNESINKPAIDVFPPADFISLTSSSPEQRKGTEVFFSLALMLHFFDKQQLEERSHASVAGIHTYHKGGWTWFGSASESILQECIFHDMKRTSENGPTPGYTKWCIHFESEWKRKKK